MVGKQTDSGEREPRSRWAREHPKNKPRFTGKKMFVFEGYKGFGGIGKGALIGAKIDGKIVGWNWMKPELVPPGALPLSVYDAGLLDRNTKLLPRRMKRPTKLAVRAMSDLGLSPQWWNEGKLKAMQQLGRYLDMELTVQMLIVRGFSTLEQAEKACQLLNALASDPKNSVDDRAFAASMIPKAVDAFRMLSEQIVSESERLPKNIKVLPAPPPPPPMNLPPQVNVQVVTGGGSSPPPLLPSPPPMEQHALPPAIPDSQPIDVESSPE